MWLLWGLGVWLRLAALVLCRNRLLGLALKGRSPAAFTLLLAAALLRLAAVAADGRQLAAAAMGMCWRVATAAATLAQEVVPPALGAAVAGAALC